MRAALAPAPLLSGVCRIVSQPSTRSARQSLLHTGTRLAPSSPLRAGSRFPLSPPHREGRCRRQRGAPPTAWQRKPPDTRSGGDCAESELAMAYFPQGVAPPSIVSAAAFHFRVRDGNGWSHRALITSSPKTLTRKPSSTRISRLTSSTPVLSTRVPALSSAPEQRTSALAATKRPDHQPRLKLKARTTLVEPRGFEPLTSAVQGQRSPG